MRRALIEAVVIAVLVAVLVATAGVAARYSVERDDPSIGPLPQKETHGNGNPSPSE